MAENIHSSDDSAYIYADDFGEDDQGAFGGEEKAVPCSKCTGRGRKPPRLDELKIPMVVYTAHSAKVCAQLGIPSIFSMHIFVFWAKYTCYLMRLHLVKCYTC